MLSALLVVLVVLWLLGMATSYTFGGSIHLLLLTADAMVLFRIIQGRDPIGD
ncbi:MAG: lmo0937 family membrane protein [Acidobacteria bacterium]|nr:lmo0937 family membrane protein [Acidobacteriota bacterium]